MSTMTDEDRLDPPPPGTGGALVACPCCSYRTLQERADFEICKECGWEDDGQDDADADIVRGGPNGHLSLSEARLEYLEATADTTDESSLGRGGDGLWWAIAHEHLRNLPE